MKLERPPGDRVGGALRGWTTAFVRLFLSTSIALSVAPVASQQSGDSPPEIAWSKILRLSDGRILVTDTAIMLDANVARPASLPGVELPATTASIIEGYLTAELPDELAPDRLVPGAWSGTYAAPSGVTLSATYVDFVKRALAGSELRFRMKGDTEPVVILADGVAVGLIMPIKR